VVQASGRHARRGGGWRFIVLLLALNASAAEVLFPKPLHLTRRIEDPFSKSPLVVEEYCAGNRVITVRGERVVIADYDRQELTEIDRIAGTYSVTRFDEIAKIAPARKAQALMTPRALGLSRAESGRAVERFEAISEHVTIEFGVDRAIALERPAIEVLLGASYPYQPAPQHEAVLSVDGLPLEQTITHQFEGRQIVVRNVITRVAGETAPAELATIPPGARRVESRFTATTRTAGELDRR
jgi:hypothetical protein